MRGSRSTGRATLTRERRGSVIVWVGVMVTTLVAFGAIAVDYGSFYVSANELQTATDAAALAGARRLQLSNATDPKAEVDAGAISAALTNRVLNAPEVITGNNVSVGYWDDDAKTFGPVGSHQPNAVQVVDTAQTSFVIGFVLNNRYGRTAPALQRGSIAWVARISGAACIKPIAFSMGEVVQMLTGVKEARSLTEAEVERFKALTPEQRTFISKPPQNGAGQVPNATPDDAWAGLAYPDPNRGMSGYQSNLRGTCQNNDPVSVGQSYDMPSAMTFAQTTEVFAGTSNGNSGNGTPGLCNFSGGPNNDTCYDPATGAMGIRFPVVYGVVAPLQTFGRDGPVQVKMIGDVRIMCYVRGATGNGNGNGNGNGQGGGNSTCNWPSAGTSTSSYSEGTIVGVVEPNFGFVRGAIEYGNGPSLAERLMLVR